jgi:hypothetical protein
LLTPLRICILVSLQEKLNIVQRSSASCAREWRQAYVARGFNAEAAPHEALDQAMVDLREEADPTALQNRQRQSTLDARTVDTISAAEIPVLNHFLATFYYACKIPFGVVDNPFFKRFIKAIRPAYASHLPSSFTLRGNMLDKVYEETVESTTAALAGVDGKRTLGLDGKTDVRSRPTVNFTDMKQVWRRQSASLDFRGPLFRCHVPFNKCCIIFCRYSCSNS